MTEPSVLPSLLTKRKRDDDDQENNPDDVEFIQSIAALEESGELTKEIQNEEDELSLDSDLLEEMLSDFYFMCT